MEGDEAEEIRWKLTLCAWMSRESWNNSVGNLETSFNLQYVEITKKNNWDGINWSLHDLKEKTAPGNDGPLHGDRGRNGQQASDQRVSLLWQQPGARPVAFRGKWSWERDGPWGPGRQRAQPVVWNIGKHTPRSLTIWFHLKVEQGVDFISSCRWLLMKWKSCTNRSSASAGSDGNGEFMFNHWQ